MHCGKGALIIVSILLVTLLLPLKGGPSALASSPTISSTPDVQTSGQATTGVGVAGSQGLLATYNVLPGSRSWSYLWAWADYVANFDLRVVLPPNMTLLEWRKDGGTVTYDAATRTIRWTGTLPKNATWYLYFRLEYPCAPDGTNLGSWSYSGTIGTRSYSGTVGPYIVRWPDLSTSSKSGPATAQVGEEVRYDIVLKNTGALTSTVFIQDLIPSGMTYVAGSAWASQGTPIYSRGVVTWTGSMGANATVQMRFRARVDRQGTFVNQLVIDEGIPACRDP
ncbi:MAG: DUF11 domain-containing protein, partial [Chloroflexi bacterium]|nr:DUF11 domain-containing protein [Chloroflexota bacterium]